MHIRAHPVQPLLHALTRLRRYPHLGLLLLAYLAFVALGMPDGLMGVAWPSVRATFSIPLDAVGLLIASSVTGYLTSSFLSGVLTARLGVGRVLAASCGFTGIALVNMALAPAWWVIVVLGVLSGLGAGAIDAGLNAYVAAHFSERLMQWLHACYGIGITLGPIIMTGTLTRFGSWRLGYLVVGLFQLALAVCFFLTLPMWERKEDGTAAPGLDHEVHAEHAPSLSETLRQPSVWLSILLFFLYVGAEASLGLWAYTLLTESRGIQPAAAGLWAGSYWALFTVGRITAGLFVKRTGVERLVLWSLCAALLFVLVLWWDPAPAASLASVALTGLAIAPIFPALVSGTRRRVGTRFAANTIGMQMAATGLGVAVLPGLLGVLARHTSLEVIPACLAMLFVGLLALSATAGRGP